MAYDVYTDGSALSNPGRGGWGTLVEENGQRLATLSGGEPHTTNNRMELLAAIQGLEWIKKHGEPNPKINVHADSTWVVKTMTDNWKRKKNLDLWAEMDKLVAHFGRQNIRWNWVKAHNGHSQNEECDTLAKNAASKQKRGPAPLPAAEATLF